MPAIPPSPRVAAVNDNVHVYGLGDQPQAPLPAVVTAVDAAGQADLLVTGSPAAGFGSASLRGLAVYDPLGPALRNTLLARASQRGAWAEWPPGPGGFTPGTAVSGTGGLKLSADRPLAHGVTVTPAAFSARISGVRYLADAVVLGASELRVYLGGAGTQDPGADELAYDATLPWLRGADGSLAASFTRALTGDAIVGPVLQGIAQSPPDQLLLTFDQDMELVGPLQPEDFSYVADGLIRYGIAASASGHVVTVTLGAPEESEEEAGVSYVGNPVHGIVMGAPPFEHQPASPGAPLPVSAVYTSGETPTLTITFNQPVKLAAPAGEGELATPDGSNIVFKPALLTAQMLGPFLEATGILIDGAAMTVPLHQDLNQSYGMMVCDYQPREGQAAWILALDDTPAPAWTDFPVS